MSNKQLKAGFTIIRNSSLAFSGHLSKNHRKIGNLANRNYCTTSAGQETKKSQAKACRERKVFVDGINVNIREEREGLHNVLCLPGVVGTIATDFGPIFKFMDTSKFRLICWEPPGYGKSRPPNRKHSADFYLDDAKIVARLMDILDYKKYSIIGWSNGGITGYTLAALFPNRVNKIVMWGAYGYADEKGVERGSLFVNTKTWAPKVLKVMESIYGKDYLEAILKDYGESFKNHFENEGNVLQERIAAVQCPSLVFHGMKDPILPMAQVEFYKKNSRNCTVRIVPDGKHDLHLTHTEEFVKEVQAFLQ